MPARRFPSAFRLGLALFIAASVALHAQSSPLTRVAATTLRLPAAPPATSYTTARVWPALAFSFPVALVTPPGETRRVFIVEKTGRIWVIPDVTAANPTRTLFLDLSARVATTPTDASDERGLLALAFHPSYATNGQFYIWWTLNATTAVGTGLHDRLSRYRVSADPNLADANSEQPLISQRDEAGNHNGGQLAFGPDGDLYLSIGDEGAANDSFQTVSASTEIFSQGCFASMSINAPGRSHQTHTRRSTPALTPCRPTIRSSARRRSMAPP